ncbi:uncharacterized protein V6R79_008858 [Siganus canaliculatus]
MGGSGVDPEEGEGVWTVRTRQHEWPRIRTDSPPWRRSRLLCVRHQTKQRRAPHSAPDAPEGPWGALGVLGILGDQMGPGGARGTRQIQKKHTPDPDAEIRSEESQSPFWVESCGCCGANKGTSVVLKTGLTASDQPGPDPDPAHSDPADCGGGFVWDLVQARSGPVRSSLECQSFDSGVTEVDEGFQRQTESRVLEVILIRQGSRTQTDKIPQTWTGTRD